MIVARLAGDAIPRPFVKIEAVPLIVGALLALLGVALLFDAWTPDETIVPRERRRRPRAERSRSGEGWIGLGVLGMAAAFLGRDSWAWSNVAVIAGAIALALGAWLNRRYFGQAIRNRGKLRRREGGDAEAGSRPAPSPSRAPDVLREGRVPGEPRGERSAAVERPRYRIR